jgi:nucleoid DNA-binding protein
MRKADIVRRVAEAAIAARRVVRFKSGKRLRASVNDPVEVG